MGKRERISEVVVMPRGVSRVYFRMRHGVGLVRKMRSTMRDIRLRRLALGV